MGIPALLPIITWGTGSAPSGGPLLFNGETLTFNSETLTFTP